MNRFDFIEGILTEAPSSISDIISWCRAKPDATGNQTYVVQFVDEKTSRTINREVIERGILRASSLKIRLNDEIRMQIVEADSTNDSTNLGSEEIGVIIQLGLFNEVIYG